MIVLLGTCLDYEAIADKWNTKYSPKVRKVLQEASERVLSSEGVACLRALLEAGMQENLAELHEELDLYTRERPRGAHTGHQRDPMHHLG